MASDRAKAIREEKAKQAMEDRLAAIEENQQLIMAALGIGADDGEADEPKSPAKSPAKKPAGKK